MKISEITENIGKALKGEKSPIPGRSLPQRKPNSEIAQKRVEQLLTNKRK